MLSWPALARLTIALAPILVTDTVAHAALRTPLRPSSSTTEYGAPRPLEARASGNVRLQHERPVPDWGRLLRRDAQAFHDDIASNHPGAVDVANPALRKINDQQLTLALHRADRTHDFSGFWFALQAYAAAFDDGHLAIDAPPDVHSPKIPARWPGFLTAFDDAGHQRVVTRAEDSPFPLGAILSNCDGRSAGQLVAANVGGVTGRWFVPATRVREAGRLFLDYGNPWITRPRRCTFLVGGKRQTARLNWVPNADAERMARRAETFSRAQDPIAIKTLEDDVVWITLVISTAIQRATLHRPSFR